MAGESPDVVLARIDERTRAAAISIERVEREVETVKRDVGEMGTKLAAAFVSLDRFKALEDKLAANEKAHDTRISRLEKAAIGVLLAVVLPVLGAVVALVVKQGGV